MVGWIFSKLLSLGGAYEMEMGGEIFKNFQSEPRLLFGAKVYPCKKFRSQNYLEGYKQYI